MTPDKVRQREHCEVEIEGWLDDLFEDGEGEATGFFEIDWEAYDYPYDTGPMAPIATLRFAHIVSAGTDRWITRDDVLKFMTPKQVTKLEDGVAEDYGEMSR